MFQLSSEKKSLLCGTAQDVERNASLWSKIRWTLSVLCMTPQQALLVNRARWTELAYWEMLRDLRANPEPQFQRTLRRVK